MPTPAKGGFLFTPPHFVGIKTKQKIDKEKQIKKI